MEGRGILRREIKEEMIKLGAKELRKIQPDSHQLTKIKRQPIYLVLDNVLDTYNVGAIFRLADAVAAEMVYLCGETARPEDPKVGHKIEKASVGVWKWVPWQYVKSAKKAIQFVQEVSSATGPASPFLPADARRLNRQAARRRDPFQASHPSPQIMAIEQHPKSISYEKADYQLPLTLVVGNETKGVSKEVLDLCDQIVEIPMWGVNKSLNVMVSLAIVLYKVMESVVK